MAMGAVARRLPTVLLPAPSMTAWPQAAPPPAALALPAPREPMFEASRRPAPAIAAAPVTADVAAPADGTALATPPEQPPITPPEPVSLSPVEWADRELRVGRAKLDAKLFDQALVTLREVASKEGAGEAAVAAHFLIASIYEGQSRVDDAIATYLEIVTRYGDDPRAPEALFLMAQDTLRSRRPAKEVEARRLFTDVTSTYPETTWAPRALMARGELEDRGQLYQLDEVLGKSVPSALVTYRQVATRYGSSPSAPLALWKLGHELAGIKRYDLAAEAFRDLATWFPGTEFDAGFMAGDLYDKRLDDHAGAQAAYARVPRSSPRYQEAQKRLLP
jgi:TolA-binding protein